MPRIRHITYTPIPLVCVQCHSPWTWYRPSNRIRSSPPKTCSRACRARCAHEHSHFYQKDEYACAGWPSSMTFPTDPDPGDGSTVPYRPPLPDHSSFRSLTGSSSITLLDSPFAGI